LEENDHLLVGCGVAGQSAPKARVSRPGHAPTSTIRANLSLSHPRQRDANQAIAERA
jgi:hypothetical protein